MHETSTRFYNEGNKGVGLQVEKFLLGLKEISKNVYQKFDTYRLGLGFSRRKVDHFVYSKQVRDHFEYVVLYVANSKHRGNHYGC